MISFNKSLVMKLFSIIVCLFVFMVTTKKPETGIINQAQATTSSFKNWQDGILMIELAPALCQINSSYSKYRQCSEKRAYVIKGFDTGHPNTVRNKPKKNLAPLQAKMLYRFMPDKRAQKQAWKDYGFYGEHSKSKYFRQIIEYSTKVQLPSNISSSTSSSLHHSELNKLSLFKQLKQKNTGLMDSSIRLLCQASEGKSILVRIDLCYQSGHFQQCGTVGNTIEKTASSNLDICGDDFSIISY